MLKRLTLVAIVLALGVVVLGAYTRLTDAGLGCPDWPGCYGQLTVPDSAEELALAQQAFPDAPVEAQKAWNEMIHRYFAACLGLLILAIAIIAWKQRRQGTPVGLPLLLLALVTFQALLGMWTVTLSLHPVIVMSHLLGGMSTLALLLLLALRLYRVRLPIGEAGRRGLLLGSLVALALLSGQIALGGWTSANYAALVCTDLPFCEGDWFSKLSFASAFSSIPAADSYLYGALDYAERMTIHVSHRFGAIIVSLWLLVLILLLWRRAPALRSLATVLGSLLTAQVLLGISNVVFILPLPVAVGHNATAALLLLVLVAINYNLWTSREETSHGQR